MNQKKVRFGFAFVVLLSAVVLGLTASRRRAGNLAVRLSLVGYTNVNGTAMALFKVQNNRSRRIWLRHVEYLLGEAFQEPAGAWQCFNQAASNRWGHAAMLPQQYMPAEPTSTSPDPTNLLVPVPPNQERWRLGVTVEFNIRMPERIGLAWKTRDASFLKPNRFINNSREAIWVESLVITNATAPRY